MPSSTSACFMVPVGRHDKIFKGMRLIKYYPCGAKLFIKPDQSDSGAPVLSGTRCPMKVYYDPPAPALPIRSINSGVTMSFNASLAGTPCLVVCN
jgi:hypothetical protein